MNEENSAPPGTVWNPYCADQSDHVKQKFLLTALCVAGKTASIQEPKVEAFCHNVSRWWKKGEMPPILQALGEIGHTEEQRADTILKELKAVKMGQYTRITRALLWLVANMKKAAPGVNWLNNVTRASLSTCPGIGFKTASFYLMYSREACSYAVLDTHILKFLRDIGYAFAPRTTPVDRQKYRYWENQFLAEAFRRGYNNRTLRLLDFKLWREHARKPKQDNDKNT